MTHSMQLPKAIAEVSATISTSAITLITFGFTAAQLDDTDILNISSDQPLRISSNSVPTSTTGLFINANAVFKVSPYGNIVNAKIIRDATSTADANVTMVLEGSTL